MRFATGGPTIVLFSKSGSKPSLRQAINGRQDVTLLSADGLVSDLTETAQNRR